MTTPTSPADAAVLDALAPEGGRPDGGSDAAETAVRIMVAAADAFAERGFSATTTRDIASRAGLSPAGVYVHFASKEVLLFELSRRGHLRARDLLVAAARDAADPTEALRAIIGGFSRWHAEHHQLGRIVQFEFRHLGPEHQEQVLDLRREIDGVVADVLAAGVASGEFDVEDVRGTALALLSTAIDVARWYSPGQRRTPESIERLYGELAVRLVRRHAG
ncbi:TetR/AcrR family transcriptional regulator [Phycicoccus avicenniae]|uniref:TetR/AcrR family transcriptional regulator n=1 Tax=Phycicoccus avicenniae TaxID=2828860 RepID=UPI002012A4EF|nr:TetR/AcrR family transcriptional regulator [Phycicoccus avicenniae]